jgi:prolyl-tRNA editing enzyme YbaK/EbsC (Cys-tRNA(Pro) deacylase)
MSFSSTRAQGFVDYLRGESLQVDLIEHDPTTSAYAEARAAGFSAEDVAKTVVLVGEAGILLAVVSAADRVSLAKVRAELGTEQPLRLATEEEMAEHLPMFEPGAIPPLGPIVPTAELVDTGLVGRTLVLVPAGDHSHSAVVDPRALVRLMDARVADIRED